MMMHARYSLPLIVAAAFFIILFSGCTQLYIPSASQAYLFKDSNEMHVAAFTGSGGYDGQIAWSPVYNFAVSAKASYLNDQEDSLHYSKQTYKEFALFYYNDGNSPSNAAHFRTSDFYFEAAAGGGFGQIQSADDEPTDESFLLIFFPLYAALPYSYDYKNLSNHVVFTSDFTRWFLQIGSGKLKVISLGKYVSIDLGATLRASYLRFTSAEINSHPAKDPYSDLWAIDYAMFYRLSFNVIMIESQLGISIPLTFRTHPSFMSAIGVRLRL